MLVHLPSHVSLFPLNPTPCALACRWIYDVCTLLAGEGAVDAGQAPAYTLLWCQVDLLWRSALFCGRFLRVTLPCSLPGSGAMLWGQLNACQLPLQACSQIQTCRSQRWGCVQLLHPTGMACAALH